MFFNALLALLAGVPLALVLLVPVAAIAYRRDGRFRPATLLQLLAGAIYFCALWAYTLSPTPPAREVTRCAAPQLQPLRSVQDVLDAGVGSPSAVLHNPALLQVVLNVALFVPFGVGVRVLLHRGLVVAALLGLGGSLLIEVTQVTGIYGIYSCAYRLFDVDDLLANTAGALLGSVLLAGVVRRGPKTTPRLVPVPVTLGRRLLGLLADAVLIGLVQFSVGALWSLWAQIGDVPDGVAPYEDAVSWYVPAVLTLTAVLRTGRTPGERLVLIENAGSGGRWRQALFGATGYCLLGPLGVLQVLFVLVVLVTAIATRDRRGLSRLVAGVGIQALGRPAQVAAATVRPPTTA